MSAGGQAQASGHSVPAPGQDPAGGQPVLQQPLGEQGHSAPDNGSDASTVPMEVGGAGGNINLGQPPSIQVMSATPNGLLCTMTPEVWQQLFAGGFINIQQPAGVQQPMQSTGGVGNQQYPLQQQLQPQPGPSGLQPAPVRAMPKGRRDDDRLMTQAEWWGLNSRSRSASWAESGITGSLLTEIRAEYDLSNYPFDSQVTFFVYTYVEVNGVRRLLRIRSIPEN